MKVVWIVFMVPNSTKMPHVHRVYTKEWKAYDRVDRLNKEKNVTAYIVEHVVDQD